MEGWTSVTIPLSPFEVNDGYGLSITMLNTVDTTSSIIPFIVTDKAINGFTVTFDSPIDSPNYHRLKYTERTESKLLTILIES